MRERWTKRVRIMGEDLVLFKDRTGKFGLIGEACPHRRASLAYGIPTEDGIRCPYHGWKFDAAGRCLEQPNEPPESTFKDKISLPGYPVQELAGLLFAYLGPLPAPLIVEARRLRGGARDSLDRQSGDPVQLAADHGELRRPDPQRVAARTFSGVRQRSVRDCARSRRGVI